MFLTLDRGSDSSWEDTVSIHGALRRTRPSNAKVSVAAGNVACMAVRIDCDECLMRDIACSDCVVSLLLGPPETLVLEADEERALSALAEGGLVPPLRLVTPVPEVIINSA